MSLYVIIFFVEHWGCKLNDKINRIMKDQDRMGDVQGKNDKKLKNIEINMNVGFENKIIFFTAVI